MVLLNVPVHTARVRRERRDWWQWLALIAQIIVGIVFQHWQGVLRRQAREPLAACEALGDASGVLEVGQRVEEARTAFSDLRCCLLDVHASTSRGTGR